MSLHRLWSGELPLDEAFWTYAVLGGIAINAITSLLFLSLVAADRPLLALLVGYGPSVPYNIVATIGVWRSAEHDRGRRSHADLIRIITLVGMVLLTVT